MPEKSSSNATGIVPAAGNAVSNSVLYLVQVGVSSLLPLVLIPIITHKLEPAEYGVFALAQVYAVIACGIANLGMAVGYERDFFLYENRKHQAGALLTSVTVFVSMNISLLFVAVWMWRDALSVKIFGMPHYGLMLFFVVVGTGLSTIANYYLTYLKNAGLAVSYVKLTILQSVINFIFIIFFLLYLNMGVDSLAYAIFLSNAVLFFVVECQQLRALPASFDKAILWGALKISLPLTPRIFFGFLGTQFDKMMLGMLATLGGVGVYSIGQKASYVVFQFMTALDRVFLPEMYRRLFSCQNHNDAAVSSKFLIPFIYVSIFVAMLVALFSEELFMLLLPPSYAGGVDIVIILSVYYASLFFGKITGTQLIYAKKTHITSLLTLVGVVLNVLLNIPMILAWGAVGAAWATLIAGAMSTLISFRVAQRYARVEWEWKPLGIIYGYFFVAVALSLVGHAIPIDEYMVKLPGKLILVAGFVYAGYRLGIVTPAGLRVLRSEAAGLLKRKAVQN